MKLGNLGWVLVGILLAVPSMATTSARTARVVRNAAVRHNADKPPANTPAMQEPLDGGLFRQLDPEAALLPTPPARSMAGKVTIGSSLRSMLQKAKKSGDYSGIREYAERLDIEQQRSPNEPIAAPFHEALNQLPSADRDAVQAMLKDLPTFEALDNTAFDDPAADVSGVDAMDVETLGEALDQARNPDPISTDADLADLPPGPIVVPKKGTGGGGTPPVPFFPVGKEEQEENPQYPVGDWRRYIVKPPPK